MTCYHDDCPSAGPCRVLEDGMRRDGWTKEPDGRWSMGAPRIAPTPPAAEAHEADLLRAGWRKEGGAWVKGEPPEPSAEVARLTAERDEARMAEERVAEIMKRRIVEAMTLTAERDEARAALADERAHADALAEALATARHKYGCAKMEQHGHQPPPCSCGLVAALAAHRARRP